MQVFSMRAQDSLPTDRTSAKGPEQQAGVSKSALPSAPWIMTREEEGPHTASFSLPCRSSPHVALSNCNPSHSPFHLALPHVIEWWHRWNVDRLTREADGLQEGTADKESTATLYHTTPSLYIL